MKLFSWLDLRRSNGSILGSLATALLVGAVASAGVARADDYPSRAITVVVPQAAGGSSDTVTRMWAQYASNRLGQPVVVENKPGGAGIIAAQTVLRAPADGYTLYSAGTSTLVLNRFTQKSLPFDSAKDFRGVAMLTMFTYLLHADPKSEIGSIADLIRVAKEKPGKINYGSAGVGNGTHLVFELLQQQTGIKMTHVPYKGEVASLVGLMGGEVQVVMSSISASLPHATAGKVRPLALLGKKRLSELPDVPTSMEAGLKGFESLLWAAIVAPAGTPDAVVSKLNAVTQEFLNDPDTKSKLAAMYFETLPGPAEAFDAVLASDIKKWTEVTRGLKLIAD